MSEMGQYLQQIIEQYNRPEVQASIKGFSKTIQFKFTDTNEAWLIRAVEGQGATLTEEEIEKPDVAVTAASDILVGIMERRLSPMAAFMSGKIRVSAPMQDLMNLQKLMVANSGR